MVEPDIKIEKKLQSSTNRLKSLLTDLVLTNEEKTFLNRIYEKNLAVLSLYKAARQKHAGELKKLSSARLQKEVSQRSDMHKKSKLSTFIKKVPGSFGG